METPRSEYTHYGTIEGVPCLIRHDGPDTVQVRGYNWLMDRVIDWLVDPICAFRIAAWDALGVAHEPGYLIHVKGEFHG